MMGSIGKAFVEAASSSACSTIAWGLAAFEYSDFLIRLPSAVGDGGPTSRDFFRTAFTCGSGQ